MDKARHRGKTAIHMNNLTHTDITRRLFSIYAASNVMLRHFAPYDRALCLMLTARMIIAFDEGCRLSINDLVDAVGSYSSPRTVRRYLKTFEDRGLAQSEWRGGSVLFWPTLKLMRLHGRYCDTVHQYLVNDFHSTRP